MPTRKLTVPEFAQLLARTTLIRKINAVHLHHTWRPRRRDFRGEATIEAMRRYHVEVNGWADIAQHLTIDPEGCAWTGRDWNSAPASSSGRNGTARQGPFMIEMVGDFDKGDGHDPFDGPQRDAAIAIVARLLQRFELGVDAIAFHRELGSQKSCPGSAIDRAEFTSAVADELKLIGPLAEERKPRTRSPFADADGNRRAAAAVPAQDPEDAEVSEDIFAAREIEETTRLAMRVLQARATPPVLSLAPPELRRDGADWSALKPHVVNLSRGVLSEGGEFSTSPEDVRGIVDAIRSYVASTEHPHVVLHAHGGLVDEKAALEYAKTVAPWWKSHDVYPVYFIWESGLLEILRQYIVGPRDIFDFTTDPAIETLTKIPGTIAWNGMKESARRSSSTDAGGGAPGGALLFARELAALMAAEPGLRVHAIGHSAGAIFHSHLLPALTALGRDIETLSLLAPAVRVDLFKEKLLPLVGTRIRQLSLFTMEEDAERQDDCFGAYRKSLLYLVSRAFEGASVRKPILGLEQFIRKDGDLKALFGLDGGATKAELQLSFAPGRDPNPLTQALRHGEFDNDPKTMSAVLRRILQVADATKLGEADYPYQLEPRTLESLPPVGFAAPARPGLAAASEDDAAPDPGDPVTAPAIVTGARPAGRALCIGIDRYVSRPLAGCVKDARTWGSALRRLGYEVTYLLDGQATREGIVKAITKLVAAGNADTPLVLQYSGHGTQVPDDNGDEVDRFDEAFVPVDFHLGRLLLDDDIGGLLARLPRDARITLFMDCCHSGTNSRFAPLVRARDTRDERVRFMPASEQLVAAHRAFRATLPAAAPAPEESLRGVVHFAACLDNEYAWESSGQGDFTGAAAVRLVEAVSQRTTNEAFMETVRQTVVARGRQHPQLMRLPKGLANQPLLATRVAAAV